LLMSELQPTVGPQHDELPVSASGKIKRRWHARFRCMA
jgi:hypothetical protein